MSEARRPHNKLDIDEDFIRENYYKMSAREIGEVLGVSREAINHRVMKMGLRKTKIPFVLEDGEELVPIEGFPDYGITNHSRVVNLRRMTLVKTKKDREGYVKVTLYRDGKAVGRRVHRLVALHFIPNPNNLPQVNHIDGDKSNPSIDNLEWVTPKENAQHASKHGLLCVGESHPSSKITEQQARSILQEYQSGKSVSEIRKAHSYASKSIVEKICWRHRWKHLDKTS
ncbi:MULTISPECIES: HNH endonuclease signature motif containing protein [Bacillus]|uniref:HNH endonuclease signature motif containing protein n=1 Tax=Bacillus paralicheniformis TaxID=1648923 RepID=A0AAW6KGC8_9BACI|nr:MULTISPECIES: HNH endonuclease signature motif containing protein [Bacillus]ETB71295.1 endonuclease [Bacillus sp. CPSM8]MCI4129436.1 HNH endonuclease [Bacillus haynesii]MDE1383288.1 HNH endonuclease signature motif containing protein [Bacillus paralicheniformis]MDE1454785.1 HNH endonuclease signature motif containing protein [Bacillus paralicheniformis]WOH90466.1 HNH endonuclease signature motif containing protein [Bacillus paralicheniformis]